MRAIAAKIADRPTARELAGELTRTVASLSDEEADAAAPWSRGPGRDDATLDERTRVE